MAIGMAFWQKRIARTRNRICVEPVLVISSEEMANHLRFMISARQRHELQIDRLRLFLANLEKMGCEIGGGMAVHF